MHVIHVLFYNSRWSNAANMVQDRELLAIQLVELTVGNSKYIPSTASLSELMAKMVYWCFFV